MPTLVGPSENASIIQLPLNALNPEQPSSGVAPFELKLDGDQLSGDVEGGFNHAPLSWSSMPLPVLERLSRYLWP